MLFGTCRLQAPEYPCNDEVLVPCLLFACLQAWKPNLKARFAFSLRAFRVSTPAPDKRVQVGFVGWHRLFQASLVALPCLALQIGIRKSFDRDKFVGLALATPVLLQQHRD